MMEEWRKRTYEFDNGGSMTRKVIYHDGEWIEHTFAYSKGYHISSWELDVSSGTPSESSLTVTYDANGNLHTHEGFTVTGSTSWAGLKSADFAYDRLNRLIRYVFGDGGVTYYLQWDALGRIREKFWEDDIEPLVHHQVFYHDGRTLVQIWDQVEDGQTVSRTPHYDVYRGYSGYQQDTVLNYGNESEIKCYLIKDEQGTIRSVVSYEYSSGNYTVSAPSYVTDAYGAWMDPNAYPANNTHYVRYISGRFENFGDESAENQTLIHLDHRHYLAYLGMFLQREPLLTTKYNYRSSAYLKLNMEIISPYRYSYNKPTMLTDLSGLCTQDQIDSAWDERQRCHLNCSNWYSLRLQKLLSYLTEALYKRNDAHRRLQREKDECLENANKAYIDCINESQDDFSGVNPRIIEFYPPLGDWGLDEYHPEDSAFVSLYGGSGFILCEQIKQAAIKECINLYSQRINFVNILYNNFKSLIFCLIDRAAIQRNNCNVSCANHFCLTLQLCGYGECPAFDPCIPTDNDFTPAISIISPPCCTIYEYEEPFECCNFSINNNDLELLISHIDY